MKNRDSGVNELAERRREEQKVEDYLESRIKEMKKLSKKRSRGEALFQPDGKKSQKKL